MLMPVAAKRVGYAREVASEHVGFLCADAPLLPPGHRVFVLHDGDGSPLVLCGSWAELMADAAEAQIEIASLH
jgi:hypothetical protein